MQDNQSAIRLEKNGRNLCTGNSRHIDIRFFFVKDRVDKKEIFICYCPTDIMLADFFTKPLQGRLFKFFRDIIMGGLSIELIDPEKYNAIAMQIKERVGNGDLIINKKKEKGLNNKHINKNVSEKDNEQVICNGYTEIVWTRNDQESVK